MREHIDRPAQFLKREEKFVTKDGEYGERKHPEVLHMYVSPENSGRDSPSDT